MFSEPRQQPNRTQQLDQMLFGRNHPRAQQQQASQNSFLNQDGISSLATKGADGLSKTLGNVQQVLQAIETTAPVVQQYAPMIKNIPALYRIMKAVNDVEDDPEPNSTEETIEDQEPIPKKAATISEKASELPPRRKGTGESKPILFI